VEITLLSLALLALLLVLAHIGTARFGRTSGERQISLIKLMLYLNFGIVGIVVALTLSGEWSRSEIVAAAVYLFLSVNAFSYAYFHIFNMSETARRIRILGALYDNPGQHEDQIRSAYSPEEMIRKRIERLAIMGEIRQGVEGKYEINRNRLLIVAKIFRLLRSVVIGKNEQIID
jgi:hypothetical protein